MGCAERTCFLHLIKFFCLSPDNPTLGAKNEPKQLKFAFCIYQMRRLNAIFFKLLSISKFPNLSLSLPSVGPRNQKSDLASARSELSSKRYLERGRKIRQNWTQQCPPFVDVIAGFKMCQHLLDPLRILIDKLMFLRLLHLDLDMLFVKSLTPAVFPKL